ncbi:MAG: hypothetical protein WEC73_01630 [Chthoniobacterales bacterium]
MISRSRRTRVLTLLAAVCCTTALSRVVAQEIAPPTAAREIILGTKTPLGEANISIAAGSTVTDFAEDGEMILIRRGPFHARVPRDQLVFPTPAPDPEPSPAAEVAPVPEAEPVTSAEAAVAPPTSAGAAFWPWEEGWTGDWQRLWPTAAVGLLGLYSLAVTASLLRMRRRQATAPLPTVRTVKAVVTNEGRSIACPLCGKDIVVDDLKGGRNTCPECGGSFICEGS